MRRSVVVSFLALAGVATFCSIRLPPSDQEPGVAWGAPASQSEIYDVAFRGEATFEGSRLAKSISARYEYRVDHRSGQGRLTIVPLGTARAFEPYSFEPEVGQQFLKALYPTHFGSLGDLICAEWEYGASTRKLTVYRLNEHGQLEAVFDDNCRFGFQILNLGAGEIPTICGGYGDLRGPKQMKVFAWSGEKFKLMKTFTVAEPHVYAIELGRGKQKDINVAE